MQFFCQVVGAVCLLIAGQALGHPQASDGQYAFQLNTSSKQEKKLSEKCPPNNALPVLRVAIIGAGASGSSAAYFLGKAREQLQEYGVPGCNPEMTPEDLHVTVYERDSRIGGRVMAVHPLNDSHFPPIDVGASIFANANHNIRHAARKFGLKPAPRDAKLQSPMGLWDGSHFVIDDFDGSRWSQLKLYWRYGKSPTKALTFAFQRIYSPRFLHDPKRKNLYPWRSVTGIAEDLQLKEFTTESAKDYFESHKVTPLCADELVNAATRGNYAQNVDRIHAFAGMVSMAANGASGIKGGNAQVFQSLLQESNATLRLGESGDVTGIMKVRSKTLPHAPSATRWRIGTRDGHGDLYDVVLIATPWHDSRITLLNTDKSVPSYRYQSLHVTLVVTDAPQPNPTYFGYDASFDRVPRTIVTAPPQKVGGKPEFLTLSYLETLNKPQYKKQWDKLYVVKLFSYGPLPAKTLDKIFGNGEVVWTYGKEWSAFPVLSPTDKLANFEVDTDLYNLNAMERWISTMETSTLAAKNVAGLVLQKWLGSHFVHGAHCRWGARTPDVAEAWDTWGCMSS